MVWKEANTSCKDRPFPEERCLVSGYVNESNGVMELNYEWVGVAVFLGIDENGEFMWDPRWNVMSKILAWKSLPKGFLSWKNETDRRKLYKK